MKTAGYKIYRVGTFVDDLPDPRKLTRSDVRTYLRDYSPTWPGCVEYEMFAPGGKEAKRAAVTKRLIDEGAKLAAKEAVQADQYCVFRYPEVAYNQDLVGDLQDLIIEVGRLRVELDQLKKRL